MYVSVLSVFSGGSVFFSVLLEIDRWSGDALSTPLILRNLRESKKRYRHLQELAKELELDQIKALARQFMEENNDE